MKICGGPVYPRLFSAHSAGANMYRRLGRTAEARASYEKALALTHRNQSGNSCESGFGG